MHPPLPGGPAPSVADRTYGRRSTPTTRRNVDEAIRWTRALAALDPYWIEEPTSPDDVLGHAAIHRAVAPSSSATAPARHPPRPASPPPCARSPSRATPSPGGTYRAADPGTRKRTGGMSDFTGLTALVAGGASGIGRATAGLLAERGARAAVLDLHPSPVAKPLLGLRADVTDDASVRAAVTEAAEALGGLDILVTTPGSAPRAPSRTTTTPVAARLRRQRPRHGPHRPPAVPVPHRPRPPAVPAPCRRCPSGHRGRRQRLLRRGHRWPAAALPVAAPPRGAVHSLTLAIAADHVREGIRVNCVNPGTADAPGSAGCWTRPRTRPPNAPPRRPAGPPDGWSPPPKSPAPSPTGPAPCPGPPPAPPSPSAAARRACARGRRRTGDPLGQRRRGHSPGLRRRCLGNLYTPVSDEQAHAAVQAAWQRSIRYVDTAPHYGLGLSERRLGAALRAYDRAHWTVSTKVGRRLEPADAAGDDLAEGFAAPAAHRRVWDFTADGIRRTLEASLARLGLDRV